MSLLAEATSRLEDEAHRFLSRQKPVHATPLPAATRRDQQAIGDLLADVRRIAIAVNSVNTSLSAKPLATTAVTATRTTGDKTTLPLVPGPPARKPVARATASTKASASSRQMLPDIHKKSRHAAKAHTTSATADATAIAAATGNGRTRANAAGDVVTPPLSTATTTTTTAHEEAVLKSLTAGKRAHCIPLTTTTITASAATAGSGNAAASTTAATIMSGTSQKLCANVTGGAAITINTAAASVPLAASLYFARVCAEQATRALERGMVDEARSMFLAAATDDVAALRPLAAIITGSCANSCSGNKNSEGENDDDSDSDGLLFTCEGGQSSGTADGPARPTAAAAPRGGPHWGGKRTCGDARVGQEKGDGLKSPQQQLKLFLLAESGLPLVAQAHVRVWHHDVLCAMADAHDLVQKHDPFLDSPTVTADKVSTFIERRLASPLVEMAALSAVPLGYRMDSVPQSIQRRAVRYVRSYGSPVVVQAPKADEAAAVDALFSLPPQSQELQQQQQWQKEGPDGAAATPNKAAVYYIPDVAYHLLYSATVFLSDALDAVVQQVTQAAAHEQGSHSEESHGDFTGSSSYLHQHPVQQASARIYAAAMEAMATCIDICEGTVGCEHVPDSNATAEDSTGTPPPLLKLATVKFLPWRLSLYEQLITYATLAGQLAEATQIATRAQRQVRELVSIEFADVVAPPLAWQQLLRDAQQRTALQVLKLQWLCQSSGRGYPSSGNKGATDTNTMTAADEESATATATLEVNMPRDGWQMLSAMWQAIGESSRLPCLARDIPLVLASGGAGTAGTTGACGKGGTKRPRTGNTAATAGAASAASSAKPGEKGKPCGENAGSARAVAERDEEQQRQRAIHFQRHAWPLLQSLLTTAVRWQGRAGGGGTGGKGSMMGGAQTLGRPATAMKVVQSVSTGGGGVAGSRSPSLSTARKSTVTTSTAANVAAAGSHTTNTAAQLVLSGVSGGIQSLSLYDCARQGLAILLALATDHHGATALSIPAPVLRLSSGADVSDGTKDVSPSPVAATTRSTVKAAVASAGTATQATNTTGSSSIANSGSGNYSIDSSWAKSIHFSTLFPRLFNGAADAVTLAAGAVGTAAAAEPGLVLESVMDEDVYADIMGLIGLLRSAFPAWAEAAACPLVSAAFVHQCTVVMEVLSSRAPRRKRVATAATTTGAAAATAANAAAKTDGDGKEMTLKMTVAPPNVAAMTIAVTASSPASEKALSRWVALAMTSVGMLQTLCHTQAELAGQPISLSVVTAPTTATVTDKRLSTPLDLHSSPAAHTLAPLLPACDALAETVTRLREVLLSVTPRTRAARPLAVLAAELTAEVGRYLMHHSNAIVTARQEAKALRTQLGLSSVVAAEVSKGATTSIMKSNNSTQQLDESEKEGADVNGEGEELGKCNEKHAEKGAAQSNRSSVNDDGDHFLRIVCAVSQALAAADDVGVSAMDALTMGSLTAEWAATAIAGLHSDLRLRTAVGLSGGGSSGGSRDDETSAGPRHGDGAGDGNDGSREGGYEVSTQGSDCGATATAVMNEAVLERLAQRAENALCAAEIGLAHVEHRQDALLQSRKVAIARVTAAAVINDSSRHPQEQRPSPPRKTNSASGRVPYLQIRGVDTDHNRNLALLLRDTRTELVRRVVELRWYEALVRSRLRASRRRVADIAIMQSRHAKPAIFGTVAQRESRVLSALLAEEPTVPETPVALEARYVSATMHDSPLLRALVLLCFAKLQPTQRLAQERFLTAMDALMRARSTSGHANQVNGSGNGGAASADVELYSPILLWSMAAAVGSKLGGSACEPHVQLAKSVLYECFVLPGGEQGTPTSVTAPTYAGTAAAKPVKASAASSKRRQPHYDPEDLADTIVAGFASKGASSICSGSGNMSCSNPATSAARRAAHGQTSAPFSLVPNTTVLASTSRAVRVAVCEAMLDTAEAELARVARSARATPAPAPAATAAVTGLQCSARALVALRIALTLDGQAPPLPPPLATSSTLVSSPPSSPLASSKAVATISPLALRCAQHIYAGLLPCLHDPQYCPHVLDTFVALCYTLLNLRGTPWCDAGVQFLAVRVLASLLEVLTMAERRLCSASAVATAAHVWPAHLHELRYLMLRTFAHVWNNVYTHPSQRQARHLAEVGKANLRARQAAVSVAAMRQGYTGAAAGASMGGVSAFLDEIHEEKVAAGVGNTNATGGGGHANEGRSRHQSRAAPGHAPSLSSQQQQPAGGTNATAAAAAERRELSAIAFAASAYVPMPVNSNHIEMATQDDIKSQSSSVPLMDDAMPVEFIDLLERLLFTVPEAYVVLTARPAVEGGEGGSRATPAAMLSSASPASPQSTPQQQSSSSSPGNAAQGSSHSREGRPSLVARSRGAAPLLGELLPSLLTQGGSIHGLPRILHDVCAALTEFMESGLNIGGNDLSGLHQHLQDALLVHRRDPVFSRTAAACVEWLAARRDHSHARILAHLAIDSVEENARELRSYEDGVYRTVRAWLVEHGFVLTVSASGGGARSSPGDPHADRHDAAGAEGEDNDGADGEATTHPSAGRATTSTAAKKGRARGNRKPAKQEEEAALALAQAAAEVADRVRLLALQRTWTLAEQQMLRQMTRVMAWARQRRAAAHVRRRFFQFNAPFTARLRCLQAALLRLEWAQLTRWQQQHPSSPLTRTSLSLGLGLGYGSMPTAAGGGGAAAGATATATARGPPSENSRRSLGSTRDGKPSTSGSQASIPAQGNAMLDSVADSGAVHAAVAAHCVKASHLFTRAQLPAHALRAVQLTTEDITRYVALEVEGAPGLPFPHLFFTAFELRQQERDDNTSANGNASDGGNALVSAAAAAYTAARRYVSPELIHQLRASSISLLPLATELLAIMALITRGYCDHRRDSEVLQPTAIRTGPYVCRHAQMDWLGALPSLYAQHTVVGHRAEARAAQCQRRQQVRAARQAAYWLREAVEEETRTRVSVERAYVEDLRARLISEGVAALQPSVLDYVTPFPSNDTAGTSATGTVRVGIIGKGRGGTTTVAATMSVHPNGNAPRPRLGQATNAVEEREKLHYFLYPGANESSGNIRNKGCDGHLHGGEPDSRVEAEVRAAQYGEDMPEAVVVNNLLILAHCLQYTHPLEVVQICQAAHSMTDGRYDAVLLPLALSIQAALTGSCSRLLVDALAAARREASLGWSLLCDARAAWERYSRSDACSRDAVRVAMHGLLLSVGLPLLWEEESAAHLVTNHHSSRRGHHRSRIHSDLSSNSSHDDERPTANGIERRADNAAMATTTKATLAAYQAAASRLRESRQFALLGECMLEMGRLALLQDNRADCEAHWHEAVESLLAMPRWWQRWRAQLQTRTEDRSCHGGGVGNRGAQEHARDSAADRFDAASIGLPRILLAVHTLSSLSMHLYRDRQTHALDACLFAVNLLERYLLPDSNDVSNSNNSNGGHWLSLGLPDTLVGYTDFIIEALPPGVLPTAATTTTDGALREVLPALVHSLLFLTHQLIAYDYPHHACLTGALAEHFAGHALLQHVACVVEARLQRARAAARAGDMAAAMNHLRRTCLGLGLPVPALDTLIAAEVRATAGVRESLALSLGAAGSGVNSGNGNGGGLVGAASARRHQHGRPPSSAVSVSGGGGNGTFADAVHSGSGPDLFATAGPMLAGGGGAAAVGGSAAWMAMPRLYNNAEPPTSAGNVASVTTFLAQCLPAADAESLVSGRFIAASLPVDDNSNTNGSGGASVAHGLPAAVQPAQFLSQGVCEAYGSLLSRRVLLTIADVLVCLATREAAYLWPAYYNAANALSVTNTIICGGGAPPGTGAGKRPGSGGSAGNRRRLSAAGVTGVHIASTATGGSSAAVEAYRAAECLLRLFITAATPAAVSTAPETPSKAAGSGRKSGGRPTSGANAGGSGGGSSNGAAGNRRKAGKTGNGSNNSNRHGAHNGAGMAADGSGDTGQGGGAGSRHGARVRARLYEAYEAAALGHHAVLLLATAATELGKSDEARALLSGQLARFQEVTAVISAGADDAIKAHGAHGRPDHATAAAATAAGLAFHGEDLRDDVAGAKTNNCPSDAHCALQSSMERIAAGFGTCPLPAIPSFLLSVDHTYWRTVLRLLAVNELRLGRYDHLMRVTENAVQLCGRCHDAYGLREFGLYRAAGLVLGGHPQEAARGLAALRSSTSAALAVANPADDLDAMVGLALSTLPTDATSAFLANGGENNDGGKHSNSSGGNAEELLLRAIAALQLRAVFVGALSTPSGPLISGPSSLPFTAASHSETTGAKTAVAVPSNCSCAFRWGAPSLVKLHTAVNVFAKAKLNTALATILPTEKALANVSRAALLMRRTLVAVGPHYDTTSAHPSLQAESQCLLARALTLLYDSAHTTFTTATDTASTKNTKATSPNVIHASPPPFTSTTSERLAGPLLRALPQHVREVAALFIDAIDTNVTRGVHDYRLLRTALLELAALLTKVMRDTQHALSARSGHRAGGGNGSTGPARHGGETLHGLTPHQYRLFSAVAASTAILAGLVQIMSRQVFHGSSVFDSYDSDEVTATDLSRVAAHLPQGLVVAIQAALQGGSGSCDHEDGGHAGGGGDKSNGGADGVEDGTADRVTRLRDRLSAPIHPFYADALESVASGGGTAPAHRRGGSGPSGNRSGGPTVSGNGSATSTTLGGRNGTGNSSPDSASAGRQALLFPRNPNSIPVSVHDMVRVFAGLHRQWNSLAAVAPPLELLDHECALQMVRTYLQARTTPVSCTPLCYPLELRQAVARSLNPQRNPIATAGSNSVGGGSSTASTAAAAAAVTSTAGRKVGGGGGGGLGAGGAAGVAAAALTMLQQQQESLDLWGALVPPVLLAALPQGLFTSIKGPAAMGAPTINAVVASSFFAAGVPYTVGSAGPVALARWLDAGAPRHASPHQNGTRNSVAPVTTLLLAVSPLHDPALDYAPPIATAADRKRLLRDSSELDAASTNSGDGTTGNAGGGGSSGSPGGVGKHSMDAATASRASVSGNMTGLRFRNRLATVTQAIPPDGTKPRPVCTDIAVYERMQELAQAAARGSNPNGLLRFCHVKSQRRAEISDAGSSDSNHSDDSQDIDMDDDEVEAGDPDQGSPHWRCVPVPLPTKLVGELRQAAARARQLMEGTATKVTAAPSSLASPASGATSAAPFTAASGAGNTSTRTASVSAGTGIAAAAAVAVATSRCSTTSSRSKDKGEDARQASGAAAPATISVSGMTAATLAERIPHMTGSEALACSLALAREALSNRTSQSVGSAAVAVGGSGGALPPSAGAVAATSSTVGSNNLQQQQQMSIGVSPAGNSSGSVAAWGNSRVVADTSSGRTANADKPEKDDSDTVSELAEVKSHLIMTLLEAIVAATRATVPIIENGRAPLHARRASRSAAEEEEEVVNSLLPRCAVDMAFVQFLQDWLSPEGDGTAVSFYHPGVHDWASRVAAFVERTRLM